MEVFQESIEQMLWPERRAKDDLFTRLNIDGPGVGWIQRTTVRELTSGCRRATCRTTCAACSASDSGCSRSSFRDGEVEIGPIPEGTPVSLLTSIDMLGADLPRRRSAASASEEAGCGCSRR